MDTPSLLAIAEQWSQDLQRVPLDRMRQVYEATVAGAKFPPQAVEFGLTWDAIHGDEVRLHNETQWQRHDQTVRALPASGGNGFRASQLHRQRLEATGVGVVCDCAPKNGWQWPAVLSPNSEFWQCARGQCSFSWPVSDTLNAPLPQKLGGLAPEVPQMAPVQKFTEELQKFADGCNVDLLKMTASDFATFRAFSIWWAQNFAGFCTYESLCTHWDSFQRETKQNAAA